MSFGKVQGAFATLRKRLALYVGPTALPDITIDPPKGTSDELSFIRLVAWGYVLVHEAGRVPLGFLRQLPQWNGESNLLPHLRALRTWTSHNLALDKTQDMKTYRSAIEWLNKACGAGSPVTQEQWQKCFAALIDDLSQLLDKAIAACDSFENIADRQRLTDQLKERLNRDWEAYRFDAYVEKVFRVFGYQGLDVVKFRGERLEAWKKVVAVSNADEIDRNLEIRIEADALQLMSNALPISAEELSTLLPFPSSEILVAALISLRSQEPRVRLDVIEALRRLTPPQKTDAAPISPMLTG